MPVGVGIVQTTDEYPPDGETGAAIVGPFQELFNIQFTVSTALVVAQIAKLDATGSLHWDLGEITLAPGVNGFQSKIHGIRFRSAVTGTPATILINGFLGDDPVPFTNPQSLEGEIDPGGTFTPTVGGIEITNGVIDINPATELEIGGGINLTEPSSGVGKIAVTTSVATRTFPVVFDGRGLLLATGIQGDIPLDFACTILEWTLLANTVGSIQVDIWVAAFAAYPPTVANSICGSNYPTLIAGLNGQGPPTGWTTAIAANSTFRFNINSVSGMTRCTLGLKLQVQ